MQFGLDLSLDSQSSRLGTMAMNFLLILAIASGPKSTFFHSEWSMAGRKDTKSESVSAYIDTGSLLSICVTFLTQSFL